MWVINETIVQLLPLKYYKLWAYFRFSKTGPECLAVTTLAISPAWWGWGPGIPSWGRAPEPGTWWDTPGTLIWWPAPGPGGSHRGARQDTSPWIMCSGETNQKTAIEWPMRGQVCVMRLTFITPGEPSPLSGTGTCWQTMSRTSGERH